ncbi:hypothetical protein LEM8419_02099 [Neolewinella maritima]|uniref:TolC family protein n=1 Tax=Neolewinella maritima TaxID=1383882 RepID=A0ABN8F2K4_9BACT|nr:hypothetical protein [Neolewinella maritima]CAH1001201.1 hypothetical protein LEM8419_02099 [Neolewinella maritima]
MRAGVVVLLCLLCSCGRKEVDPQLLIEERAASQIAGMRATVLRNCERDVQEAAVLRADSLLLDRARRMRRIAGRPPKPGRPGAPPVLELSEPLPLRPLFPFEIRFDTLLRDSLLRDSLLQDSLLLDSLYQDSLRLDSSLQLQ